MALDVPAEEMTTSSFLGICRLPGYADAGLFGLVGVMVLGVGRDISELAEEGEQGVGGGVAAGG
ncbi:MAG TPA: hypothetical protein VGM10_22455, partial [Actinocrinis sp.]